MKVMAVINTMAGTNTSLDSIFQKRRWDSLLLWLMAHFAPTET